MARYSGRVGFRLPGKKVAGVVRSDLVERAYSGSILEETATQVKADKVNDDVSLTERISIMADGYALENWPKIKYVERAGVFWAVTSVKVQRPRLVLSLGGVYDGERAAPSGGVSP